MYDPFIIRLCYNLVTHFHKGQGFLSYTRAAKLPKALNFPIDRNYPLADKSTLPPPERLNIITRDITLLYKRFSELAFHTPVV